MFCKNCGKEIEDGAAFCNNCGTAVGNESSAKTSGKLNLAGGQNSSSIKEVFVRGFKCAGNGKYYAFCYYVPLIVFILGLYLWQYTALGLILALLGFIFALVVKKIFKQSLLYDEIQEAFIYNAHSHLSFTVKKLNVSDIKSVRIRYVKVGFGTSKFSLNDPGKYHVISLDAVNPENSIRVWFPKNGNAEEFIPVINYALQKSGKQIQIDCKEDLMKGYDFEMENQNS